jgi:cob(I)alamin adenosyltransferase
LKIYTKGGDRGETGLAGGARVPKDAVRVATYGDVDELNALLGLVRTHELDPDSAALLGDVQRALFAIGAQLADPTARVGSTKPKAALGGEHVEQLEHAIDARDVVLPPLRTFILPGGAAAGAWLHLARTVCRRAERGVVTLAREASVDPLVLIYLNRLSDLLFVMARSVNQLAAQPEEPW